MGNTTYPWHLPRYEAAVPLGKVSKLVSDWESLLPDVDGLQHPRVAQLFQHTWHVQLECCLVCVGLDASHKPRIASVKKISGE